MAGSLALISGLAMFSVARAPGAIGQLATVNVGNTGGAVASSGGNSATGNSSTNSIDSTATGGGLVGATVGLGAPTNTSTGTATINSGPATAAGNQSQNGIGQTNTGGGTSPFGTGNNQSATVDNTGDAVANTGGNTAVGNNSENTIGATQSVGLIDAVVGLGAATNTSTGTANVTTGPANAVGNVASTAVNQARVTDTGGGGGLGTGGGGFGGGGFGGGGFGGGGGVFHATPFQPGVFPGTVNGFGSSFDPCSGRFFPFAPFLNDPSGQRATVTNDGLAAATTGNNTAVGNNSTNTQTINQTASGGLIGLNVNLGSPTNNSSGTATINTGAANASGNQSSTTVNQFCGDAGGGSGDGPFVRNVITGGPIPVAAVPIVVGAAVPVAQAGTLARTGFESGMIVVAVALVLFGLAMLFTARRRLSPAGRSGSISTSEWDSIVRW
jgi:hypothetical protein